MCSVTERKAVSLSGVVISALQIIHLLSLWLPSTIMFFSICCFSLEHYTTSHYTLSHLILNHITPLPNLTTSLPLPSHFSSPPRLHYSSHFTSPHHILHHSSSLPCSLPPFTITIRYSILFYCRRLVVDRSTWICTAA